MSIPTSGTLSASAINVILGRSSNDTFSLGDPTLTSIAARADRQMKFVNLYGKSTTPPSIPGAILEIMMGTSNTPTIDSFNNSFTPSTNPPIMINDSTRGFVLRTIGGAEPTASNRAWMATTCNLSLAASYTKATWVYPTVSNQTTNNGHIISANRTTKPGTGHFMFCPNGRNVGAGHTTIGSITNNVTDPNELIMNTWTHFVVTYDNPTTTFTMYRDGSNVATTSNASFAWTGLVSSIGIGSTTSGNAFTGYLDNVRLYNRVLSSNEVQTLYFNERLL